MAGHSVARAIEIAVDRVLGATVMHRDSGARAVAIAVDRVLGATVRHRDSGARVIEGRLGRA
jgi:hypothetical protein